MHVQVTWGTYHPVQSIVAVPQVHPIQLTSNKTQMQTTLAYSHQWTNLVKYYGIVTFGCIAWQTLLQMFLVPSTSHANHHVNALHCNATQCISTVCALGASDSDDQQCNPSQHTIAWYVRGMSQSFCDYVDFNVDPTLAVLHA